MRWGFTTCSAANFNLFIYNVCPPVHEHKHTVVFPGRFRNKKYTVRRPSDLLYAYCSPPLYFKLIFSQSFSGIELKTKMKEMGIEKNN